MGSQNISQAPAKRQKKRSGVWIAVLLLFLGAGTLVFLLWRGRPAAPPAALDAYFQRLAARDYERIRQESGFSPTAFNSWDDYTDYLHGVYGDQPGEFTYRTVSAAEQHAGLRYAVYSGEQKLGEVALFEDTDQPDGWRVSADISYQPPCRVSAPGHALVSLGGSPLDPAALGAAAVPLPEFSGLPAAAPFLWEYELPPTLRPPALEAEGTGGEACELTIDKTQGTASVTVLMDEAQRQSCTQALKQAAQVYANFISEDATFATLSRLLYPDTDYFEKMREHSGSWAVEHESFSFKDTEISALRSCAEDSFTGDIRFTYEVYEGPNIHTFPAAYHMAFTKYEGSWKLVSLQEI